MSRILQGTSNIIQVDTSLLLQRLLQFAFTLTCPHGLTTTCWLLKASSTCLQGFFSWLHGFKDSLLGFMASRLLHLDSWIQYSNNLMASLLGFMASILKQSPFFIATSSSSLLHPYIYCHIIIIINDNIFSTSLT
jgi:hypothetical protein